MKLARGDIVSFIDADDVMMPRRLEAVRTAFENGAQFVVHNFTRDLEAQDGGEAFEIDYNVLVRAPSLCIVHKRDNRIQLHHSQSSLARSITDVIQYREEPDYERREDAIFCGDIVIRGYPTAYIANVLTMYDESGVW
jgi:hypothetical protein